MWGPETWKNRNTISGSETLTQNPAGNPIRGKENLQTPRKVKLVLFGISRAMQNCLNITLLINLRKGLIKKGSKIII